MAIPALPTPVSMAPEGVNVMVAVVVAALTLDARAIAKPEITPVMVGNVPTEVVATMG